MSTQRPQLNVLERMDQIFVQYAERPLLIDGYGRRTFTYGECSKLASDLASAFRSKGVKKGDRVAILMENSAELVLAYLGCLFIGAVAVPVNPNLNIREIEFILDKSNAKLITYSPSTEQLIKGLAFEAMTAEFLRLLASDHDKNADNGRVASWSSDTPITDTQNGLRLAQVDPNDIFSINFTSGTTSLPKGVVHRAGALLENAVAFNQLLGIGPDSRFLHVFHMTYMAGFLNTLLSPIMAGSSVVLARAFDAQSILDFWQPVIRNEVNTMWIAPTMAAALVRGDRRKDGVDYCQEHHMTICVGTAPLPQTTKDEFEQKYGVELHESYGLSEILFVTSNSPDIPNKPGSVGLPVPGVTIKISNDRGEAREIGNDGNVWINTPYASVGYLDFETSQPDAFDSKMWFETGDYGHVDDDGLLFITGRTKDQIIRGGINISPRAVEEAILTHSAVDKVAVIGMPHAFYGEEVVAVLLFKDGYALAEEQDELTKICGEYLSKPSIPSKFVEAKEFPISINGKIQKNVLRERLLGRNSDSLSASKLN